MMTPHNIEIMSLLLNSRHPGVHARFYKKKKKKPQKTLTTKNGSKRIKADKEN